MFQKIIRGQLQGFYAQKWSIMTLQDLQGCLKLLDGKQVRWSQELDNVSFLIISLYVYGKSKQDNKNKSQMVIDIMVDHSASLLMEIHQHLVVMITLFVYGISRQDNKKPNQMVILVLSRQSVSLLMETLQLLVGMITLFYYGMIRKEKKFFLLTNFIKIFLSNLKHHYIKTILYNIFFIIIFQYPAILQFYKYLKQNYFNYKERQSLKEIMQILRETI
ncbi:unnamed protein product [Paramecium primaurelia]|uniref:Transmembrane protein n=1 Tax=Paramecium primaurelia TaxID=5886 RepID=A0A8S1NF08_PARPR|nr:unnamed protein product [Paramecium primaurelia]